MKKLSTIFAVLFFTVFILSSCGGSESKEPEATIEDSAATTEETAGTIEETSGTTDESSTKTEESSSATEVESTVSNSDCDEFIKDYEGFVNSYITVARKMKANPTDMTILSEYTEMASKATTMQSKAGDCTDAIYADKIAKLATKLAKAGM